MAFIRACKNLSSKKKPHPDLRDTTGIALFMVIAAISVLAILVTEFTYISQVNQMLAYGGLDQLKAHYLAKSGLKLSLLRLKAYQQVRGLINSAGATAGGVPPVPKSLLQQIWSFPFFYPLPTNLPGLTLSQKETISTFQKNSNLEGRFSSVIESESSKLNINALLAPYGGNQTQPPPSSNPAVPNNQAPTSSPTPSVTSGAFNSDEARQSIADFLDQLWQNKLLADPDFAAQYRDFRIVDLVDQILAWADRTYDRRTAPSLDKVPMKKAPFYSLKELLMLPSMDDEIYQVFAPSLTVSPTPGLNINTMTEATLRAILPGITKDETTEFFKFRDNMEVDNKFKDKKDFYAYLRNNIAAFRGNQKATDDLEASLLKRNIRLIVDESEFKITVQASLNQSTETIEAWVTLSDNPSLATPPTNLYQPNPQASPQQPTSPTGSGNRPPDIGLRINFMKIL